MAIQVQIQNVKAEGTHVALCIDTTNDAHPGETLRFEAFYALTMSAAEIQAAINAAVTLLWIAVQNPSWTVS